MIYKTTNYRKNHLKGKITMKYGGHRFANKIAFVIVFILIVYSQTFTQSYNSSFPYFYGFEDGTKQANGDGYCSFGGDWDIATINPRTGTKAAYLPSFSGGAVHSLDFLHNFGNISFIGDEIFFFYLASTGVLQAPLPVADVHIMYSTDGGSNFLDLDVGPSPYRFDLVPEQSTYAIGLGYYLPAAIFSGKPQVVFRIRVSVYEGFDSTPPLHVDDVNLTGGALPITMASFTASVINGSNVLLEWTTISEVNNYGFYVERRAEDEQVFTELPNNFIAGAGTTLKGQYYSWIDENVSNNTYYYRLRQVDLDGRVSYSFEIKVEVSGALDSGSKIELPKEFALHQNYPNPFNPNTTIRFEIPKESYVTLKIYNILGQEVTTLVDEKKEAGVYNLAFDIRNSNLELSSGVYFYRLEATWLIDPRKSFIDVKKLILLK